MKRLALALAVFLAMPAYAADIAMTWDHDLLDTGGASIPPDVLTFNVYVSTDGADPVNMAVTTEMNYLWENPPIGCHTMYITAYRADSDLESVASNSEEKCVTEDTDGTLEVLMPRAPQRFRSRWRLFN